MPVTSEIVKASITVVVEEQDGMGKSHIKRRSYNMVKPNAAEQNLFNVATALMGLSSDTFLDLESIKVNSITSY